MLKGEFSDARDRLLEFIKGENGRRGKGLEHDFCTAGEGHEKGQEQQFNPAYFVQNSVFRHLFLHDDYGESVPREFLGGRLGIVVARESPQLDPIIGGLLSLKMDNGYLGRPEITFCQAILEFHGVFDLGKRAGLERVIQACADRPNLGGTAVDHFNAYRDGPGSDHTQTSGRSIREIDDPSFDKGTTVVNQNLDGSSVLNVGDYDPAAKWEGLVSCGQVVLIVDIPTGGASAVESRAIP